MTGSRARPALRRLRWPLVALAIAFAAVYPYRHAGRNGFVYDDTALVQDDPRVQHLRLAEIFRTEYWNSPNFPSRLYRPVTLASYAIERRLLGPSPYHFHRVNVALHALVAGLVGLIMAFLLARQKGGSGSRDRDDRAGGSVWPAALAAGVLFACHPIHSEAVAGIVGRAELLAALFALGSLACFLRGEGWRIAGALLAFPAFLSKENSLLLLPLLLLAGALGLFPVEPRREAETRRPVLRRLLAVLLWVGPPLIAAGVLRWAALRHTPAPQYSFADNPVVAATGLDRLATAANLFARYLWLHLWPVPLSPDYSHPVVRVRSLGEGAPWIGLALMAASGLISFLCLRAPGSSLRSRRGAAASSQPLRRLAGFALSWYFLGVLAIINLFVLIGTGMAERLAYLPGVGLFLLAGLAFAAGSARVRLAIASAVSLGLVLVWIPLCDARTRAWESPYTLFQRAVRDVPQSPRVWALLGDAQMRSEEWAAARVSLERAVSLNLSDVVARVALLNVLQSLGDLPAARACARELRDVNPEDPRIRYFEATLAARAGDRAAARRMAEEGLALDPAFPPLHLLLGQLAEKEGRPAEAIERRRLAFAGTADTLRVWQDLGALLVRFSAWPEAVPVYRILYRTRSDWYVANTLAYGLASVARLQPEGREEMLAEAFAAIEVALAAAPASMRKYPLDTLATLQWVSGRRQDAIATLERLVQEAPWEDAFRRKLASYRAEPGAPGAPPRSELPH